MKFERLTIHGLPAGKKGEMVVVGRKGATGKKSSSPRQTLTVLVKVDSGVSHEPKYSPTV